MPKPQYGWTHQKARRIALANLVEGTPCPFCGRPMYRRQALDLDHVIPVSRGGTNGPTRLAHHSCNHSAGSRLGNKSRRRNGRRRAARAPRRRLPKW